MRAMKFPERFGGFSSVFSERERGRFRFWKVAFSHPPRIPEAQTPPQASKVNTWYRRTVSSFKSAQN